MWEHTIKQNQTIMQLSKQLLEQQVQQHKERPDGLARRLDEEKAKAVEVDEEVRNPDVWIACETYTNFVHRHLEARPAPIQKEREDWLKLELYLSSQRAAIRETCARTRCRKEEECFPVLAAVRNVSTTRF
jgi:predicted house-cleaning NTP pyrophosphatase (Maf/HAM1 superfamily)